MMSGFEENYGLAPFTLPVSQNMPPNNPYTSSGMPQYGISPMSYKRGGHLSPSNIGEHLRKKGQGGDDILAHINPEEAQELGYHFGYDINPHTGLPQFGFFKKARKAVSKALHKTGISKALPVIGAIAGNYIAPGIGGVIGGGIGGALSGKKPLRGALTGSAIGAAQGYGFPAFGKLLSSQGMPQLGQAFTQLGGSRFGSGLSSLGAGLGLTSPETSVAGASVTKGLGTPAAIGAGLGLGKMSSMGGKRLKMAEEEAQTIPQDESIPGEGLGISKLLGSNLLDYLLLGVTGAGILGGKTKHKIPKEYRNEPSFEEVLERMQNPNKKGKPYVSPEAYEPPEWYSDVSGMEEHGYDYPQIRSQDYRTFRPNFLNEPPVAYKKGGHVKKFGKGGMMDRGRVANQAAAIRQSIGTPLARATPSTASIIHGPGNIPNQMAAIRQKSFNELAKAHQPTPISAAPSAQKEEVHIPSAHHSTSTSSYPTIRHKSYNDLDREQKEIKSFETLEKLGKVGLQNSLIPDVEIPENFLSYLLSRSIQGYGSPEDKMREIIQMGRDLVYPNESESHHDIFSNYDNPKKHKEYYEMFKNIPAYQPPEWYSDVSGMEEKGHSYPKFNKGGYIDGDAGGQDDNVHRDLPQGSFIVNATDVSMLGDGNSKAGAKKLDELCAKYEHYSTGDHVLPKIMAKVSEGEYEIPPHVLTGMGNGSNQKGSKIWEKTLAKLRKHKGVKKLPPKSKPLHTYLRA